MAPPLASPAPPPSEDSERESGPAFARPLDTKQTLMGVAPDDLGMGREEFAPPSVRMTPSSGLRWRVATGAETPPEMSSAEVVAAYLKGEVNDETHFWREGMSGWARAHEISELRVALVARGLSPKAPSTPPRASLPSPPVTDESPFATPFASPAAAQGSLADDFDDVTVALDVNRSEFLLRESAAPPRAAEFEPAAPAVDDLRAPLSFHDLPRPAAPAHDEADWQRPSSHSLPSPAPFATPFATPPPSAGAPEMGPRSASDSSTDDDAPRRGGLLWAGLAAILAGAAIAGGLYATGNLPGIESGDTQDAQIVIERDDSRIANSTGTPNEAKAAVQSTESLESGTAPDVTQASGTVPDDADAKATSAAEVSAKAKAEREAREAEANAEEQAKALADQQAKALADQQAKALAEEKAKAEADARAAAAKLTAEANAAAVKRRQETDAKRAADQQIAARKAAAAKAAEERAAKKLAAQKEAAAKAAAAPKPFSKSTATRALGVSGQNLSSCKTPGGARGTGKVTVTFSPDGVVRRALIQGSLSGTPAGGCVARVFRKTRIEPFAGEPQVIVKGFRL